MLLSEASKRHELLESVLERGPSFARSGADRSPYLDLAREFKKYLSGKKADFKAWDRIIVAGDEKTQVDLNYFAGRVLDLEGDRSAIRYYRRAVLPYYLWDSRMALAVAELRKRGEKVR